MNDTPGPESLVFSVSCPATRLLVLTALFPTGKLECGTRLILLNRNSLRVAHQVLDAADHVYSVGDLVRVYREEKSRTLILSLP